VSGTEVLRNPTVLEILNLVRTGVVHGLVVADLDRLFRPTEPTDYAILQVFKDTNATIYSGDTEYKLGTKDGQLMSNLRSAISGFEIQLMKERQQGAREEKRRKGHCPTNRLTMPYGTTFNRTTQRWEWTEKAATVAEVFRLIDEGERNYSKLAKRFGVTAQTIRNWLANQIYIGWKVWSQKRGEKRLSQTGKSYRAKVNRQGGEIIRAKVLEPLISEEVWNRVQAIAKETHFNHIERLTKDTAVNLGAGVLVCGYCGHPFYCASGKRSDGKRHGYYQCKSRYYLYRNELGGCKQPHVRQSEMDALIEAFAVETLTDEKTLGGIIEASLDRMSAVVRPFPVAASAEANLQALKKREKRLVDAYEAGEIELPDLRQRREDIRKLTAAAERTGSERERKQDFDLEQFVGLVVRGALRLRRITDLKEKKELIHALFSKIVVKDDAITEFELRADLKTALRTGLVTADGLIHLAGPFRLKPEVSDLPPGTKRCLHCKEMFPVEQYRGASNRCRPCVAKQSHEAYLRRRQHGRKA
jgi:DNA invertase Pin-like site-specific DNA recombinase